MTYVDMIIPTRGRWAKLSKTLDSIPREAAGKEIRVVVVFDGDPQSHALYVGDKRIFLSMLLPKQVGSVAARNLVTAQAEDAVLMGTDDIVFSPKAIEAAIRAFEERFPDGDGVVGFNQANHKSFSPTGVCLVGQKFLRRYEGKKLYFPGYFHFACQEIDRLASSLGKLWVEPKAKLFHAHPSTGHGSIDRTHFEARKRRSQDLALSKSRAQAGLTWGAA